MPKLKHTGILLILLISPFLIKLYFGGLMEVYPSITLPAYPSLLNAESGEVIYTSQKLYVQTHGDWVLLDQANMFYPLRQKFRDNIIGNEFGLGEGQVYGDRKLYTVLKNLQIIKNRDLSFDERQQVIDWLKIRLDRMDVQGNKIKIVGVQKTANLSAKLLKEEIVYEKIIELY